MSLRRTPILALLGLLAATPSAAQVTAGASFDYLGYTFDDGLGTEAAQLLMVPVGLRVPMGGALTLDVSSAWAQGRVEQQGVQLELQGFTDTNARLAYQATPWGLVTVGVNIPTGNAQHDSEEAVVASVLSTDLLGFREASWGRGLALTSSLALARSVGSFGLGLAGAYSVRGKFNPSDEVQSLEYQPGNEARVRLGVDRNFGNSTLTLGGTFINYAEDRAGGQNLFRAGNRFRFDATYAWRMGAGVWTLYAADLYRQNGDQTLELIDGQGASQGFTEIETPRQNLAVVGLVGAVGLGGGFVFRPHADFKLQTVEDSAGSDQGSGWLAAVGGDLPMRIFGGYDFFPKARVILGSIKDSTGEGVGVLGMEFTGTVRATF